MRRLDEEAQRKERLSAKNCGIISHHNDVCSHTRSPTFSSTTGMSERELAGEVALSHTKPLTTAINSARDSHVCNNIALCNMQHMSPQQEPVSSQRTLVNNRFRIKRPWSPLDEPLKDTGSTTPDSTDEPIGCLRRHSEGAVYLAQFRRPHKSLRDMPSDTDRFLKPSHSNLIKNRHEDFNFSSQLFASSSLSPGQEKSRDQIIFPARNQYEFSHEQFKGNHMEGNLCVSHDDSSPKASLEKQESTTSITAVHNTPSESSKPHGVNECPPPPPKCPKTSDRHRSYRAKDVKALLSSEQRHPKSRTRRRLLELDQSDAELETSDGCLKESSEPQEIARPPVSGNSPIFVDRTLHRRHNPSSVPLSTIEKQAASRNPKRYGDISAVVQSEKSETGLHLSYSTEASNTLTARPRDSSPEHGLRFLTSNNNYMHTSHSKLNSIDDSNDSFSLIHTDGCKRQTRICQSHINPHYVCHERRKNQISPQSHDTLAVESMIAASSKMHSPVVTDNHHSPIALTELPVSSLPHTEQRPPRLSNEFHPLHSPPPLLIPISMAKTDQYPEGGISKVRPEIPQLYLPSPNAELSAHYTAGTATAADSGTSPDVFPPPLLVFSSHLLSHSGHGAVNNKPGTNQTLSPPLTRGDMIVTSTSLTSQVRIIIYFIMLFN